MEQLPQLHKKQIIAEPAMRNTAPCILMASLKIHKQNPDAVMVVAPSDHWIEDESAFISNLQNAFDFAETSDALMTLGIQPTFANTGYGYIEYDKTSRAAQKKVIQAVSINHPAGILTFCSDFACVLIVTSHKTYCDASDVGGIFAIGIISEFGACGF